MLGKFLCRLGWHRWTDTAWYTGVPDCCERCGKYEDD